METILFYVIILGSIFYLFLVGKDKYRRLFGKSRGCKGCSSSAFSKTELNQKVKDL